jgi:hypothetical protein
MLFAECLSGQAGGLPGIDLFLPELDTRFLGHR